MLPAATNDQDLNKLFGMDSSFAKSDSKGSAQPSAAQQDEPSGEKKRGAKFAELKAQEAAKRAAKGDQGMPMHMRVNMHV